MTGQAETVKNICLNKWRGEYEADERLNEFDCNFEKWLQQIPEENHSTVLTLIANLEYYSHRETNKWLKDLHKQLLENKNISDENTIYAFIKSKDGGTNSSNDYWTEYKAINNINKNICLENMDVIDDADLPFIDNFVFIDDFSGTGKSFINELKKNTSRYNGKNVYFITINIMISATRKIECYCRENNIKIIILSEFRQDKTFSRNLFDDNSKAKEEITTMSEDLIIPESEIMGFKKSQALVAFYNNTPNNTLGFIRYDTKKYNSIFPRRNDIVPGWINMKRARMARKTTNYNSKAEE